MQKQAEDEYHPANDLSHFGYEMVNGLPKWVYPKHLPPATPLQLRLAPGGGMEDYTDPQAWLDTASGLKSRNPFDKYLGASKLLRLGASAWKNGPKDFEWQLDRYFNTPRK